MTTPVALTETFLSCVGATCTVGTGGASWIATCTAGGLTHTYDVDDMTNNAGGGFYEDVKTTQMWEGDVTFAYKTGSPPPIQSGDIFPVSIALASGPTIAGDFRFNGFQYPLLNPKSGLKISGKLKSQGAITYT